MTSEQNLLKYISFKSQIDPSFWQRFTQLKLDVDRLNEKTHRVWGYYSNKKPEGQNQLFSVDASSFNQVADEGRLIGVGSIINKNTIEGFKEEDKLELLRNEGKQMMKIIKESALEQPHLLAKFLILSFANLKSYQYYYWFAFPAPTFLSCKHFKDPESIKQVLNCVQMNVLCEFYNKNLDMQNRGFFFLKVENENLQVFTLKEGLQKISLNEDWFLGFSDTSDSNFPSWPLRNFITFVAYHCPEFAKRLRIICLRLYHFNGQWRADNSIVLNVTVSLAENAWEKAEAGENWVGWEKNEKGKMGPRLANLKEHMDPLSLAESAVDLNLKLMKWMILPDLNLDAMKTCKCLLIGAGTLGCTIARNLMCWGVRHITFIDYGTISHSNPVRQFLYKFEDSGKSKAETAALALKEIFPGMVGLNVEGMSGIILKCERLAQGREDLVSSGFTFAIPMPGHPVGEPVLQEARESVEKLENLVDDHDAIFLLMDSRESRWLPTVIAAAKGKLVINAALGFDSYLVMRHGVKVSMENEAQHTDSTLLSGDKLGCYFCSDVTAPGNSFKGRTLDQQCTVTRPGVSGMAGALAVELFVSVLQHPLRGLAPAESDPESSKPGSLLGIVPHSIRGFISHYQSVLPAVECYSSCVACSQKVINKYVEEGFYFIFKCLESKDYLEELCGLKALQNEPLLTEVLEYSSSESDE